MSKRQALPLDTFERDGFLLLKGVLAENDIKALIDAVETTRSETEVSATAPGLRLLLRRCWKVRRLARSAVLLQIAASALGGKAKPVKAILFDKTPASNWYVTWHQDLTIAVKEKLETTGFGPWSVKDGIPHVQPPPEVLGNMVSLRIHLDGCAKENGAIRFIPGSHRAGIMSSSEVAEWRETNDSVCCAAEPGDVILMRPLILHSSSQSVNPDHRRVLHIEYVGSPLPGGLKWAEASGLDTVEMVMAIEEEFGVDIPDEDAERITTVGEMYHWLRRRLSEMPHECLTQKMFYKLRRALIENYKIERRMIKPDTKVTDLLSLEEVEQGWPFLQLFIDLKTPPFKVANELLAFKLFDRMLTMREMVSALISLNSKTLFPKMYSSKEQYTDQEIYSDQDIWPRLVEVIARQANLNRDEIIPGASFTRDLGLC